MPERYAMPTSPGKCELFCHPKPDFSFYSFIGYQIKMIPCFVEIFEGGIALLPAFRKHYKNLNLNFNQI